MAALRVHALVGITVVIVLSTCLVLHRKLASVPHQATKYSKRLTPEDSRSGHGIERKLDLPPPCRPQRKAVLTEEDITGIEKFVIFVGYARSGHSIIGSLMDAHPNMIIAHEYMIFNKWDSEELHYKLNGNRSYLFNELYRRSYGEACSRNGYRSKNKDSKGYTLFVNSSWQGQFKDLKIIGDKSGGKAGKLYSKNSTKAQNFYQEMSNTVKVLIHSLHVVRNPFDIISTAHLYRFGGDSQSKYIPPTGTKLNDTAGLDRGIGIFFGYAEGVRNMIQTCKLTVLEIRSEDFVKQPQEIMKRICDFLGVECSPWYLQMCQDKVFPSVSRSRDKVEWTEEQIARVQKLMDTFPYFKGYNFIRDDYVHS